MSAARGWTRADALAVLLLMVVGLLPRVYALDADPPFDVATAFFYDEGWWANNARNYVKFGSWVFDEHNPGLTVAPLYNWVMTAVYSLGGVSLVNTRMVSAVAGFLACVVLFVGLRRHRSTWAACIPAAVLAVSYHALVMSRLAYVESLQLLWTTMVFGAVLWAPGRMGWSAGAGVALVLAILTKPSALMVVPIVVAYWGMTRWRWRDAAEPPIPVAPFVVAGVVGLVIVLAVHVGPWWSLLKAQLASSSNTVTGTVATDQAKGIVSAKVIRMTFSPFFTHNVVLLTAVVALAATRLLHRAVPRDRPELWSWAWLVIGLAILSLQPFQPDRRFLFLLPAVAVLASDALAPGQWRLPEAGERTAPWRTVVAGALVGGWIGFVAWPVVAALGGDLLPPRWLAKVNPRGPTAVFTLGVVTGVMAFWWAGQRARGYGAQAHRRLMVVLAAAFVIYDPGRFLWHSLHRRYFIRDAIREVARVTSHWPEGGAVLFGEAAATLGLQSRARPVMQVTWGGRRVNVGAVDRFHPVAVLMGQKPPAWVAQRGFALCREFPLRKEGRRRWPPLALFTLPGFCPEPRAGA